MKKSRNFLLVLLWFLMLVMVVGVILFFFHNDRMGGEEWSVGYWAFIISIFSALFSGLNVLVFYQLTIAVEQQNDNRQQENAYYDGLKYKLEQQRDMQKKIEDLYIRYSSGDGELIGRPCVAKKDFALIDGIVMDDKMLLLSLLQSSLFTGVSKDDVQDVLDFLGMLQSEMVRFVDDNVYKADSIEFDDILKKWNTELEDFFGENAQVIDSPLKAIREAVIKDIQDTLLETIQMATAHPKPAQKEEVENTLNNSVPLLNQLLNQTTNQKQFADLIRSYAKDIVDNTLLGKEFPRSSFDLQNKIHISTDVDELYKIQDTEM